METNTALIVLAIVGIVVVSVAATVASRRLGWSAPLVLVAVGAGIALIPAVPTVTIQPDLVLYGLLPPLLFSASLRASLIDLRARRDPILMSSVGLVAFTVLVAGVSAWLLIPGLTLAAAFAFGAVVAPTDQAAVEAVTRRAKLPRLLSTVLDGENLLNDATSLVALNSAVLAITATITPVDVGLGFLGEVAGGLLVGFTVAWFVGIVRNSLRAPVLDTSLSLVTPFIAFALAQLIHGSGALAVVVAGLFLGYRAPRFQSAEARIAESLNWRTIQFLVENAVFLLIGLSLPAAIRGAEGSGIGPVATIATAVAIVLVLLLSRLVWGLFTTALFRWGPERFRRVSWRWGLSAPWTLAGVRGVVTLAAVFLLPYDTPQRSFLQLIAFAVVVGTLLEALAIPAVMRGLRLPTVELRQERIESELLMAEAKTAGLQMVEGAATQAVDTRVFDRLRADAAFVSDSIESEQGDDGESLNTAYSRLRIATIRAERDAVLSARAEGRYQEAAVRTVMQILDAEETAARSGRPHED